MCLRCKEAPAESRATSVFKLCPTCVDAVFPRRTMIKDQMTQLVVRANRAGFRGGADQRSDLRTWLDGNASSDVLMAMVRGRFMPVSLASEIAQLAGCPHERGACTGILARRGYTGHHNGTLYGGVS